MKIKTNDEIIDVSNLEHIGLGGTYSVYALDERKILKVSYKNNQVTNPAKVLKDLQGVIMTPKLYEYDDDWYIIERIHGYTAFEIIRSNIKDFSFDYSHFLEQSKQYFREVFERGWQPADLYARNIMLDLNGDYWVIDHDCFTYSLGEPTYDLIKQMEEENKGNPIMLNRLKNFQRFRAPRLYEDDHRLNDIFEVGKQLNEVINND